MKSMKTITRAAVLSAGAAALAVPLAGVGSSAAQAAQSHDSAPSSSASAHAGQSGAEKGAAAAKDFQEKWEGKHIDVDGAYGAQCWDLAAQYSQDLGLGEIKTGNGAAKDIYEQYETNGNAQNYDRIANSTSDKNSYPRAGDVIVWDGGMGDGYGHVAVVLKADFNHITVLEQNPGDAHVKTYDGYDNVEGWLRPKQFA